MDEPLQAPSGETRPVSEQPPRSRNRDRNPLPRRKAASPPPDNNAQVQVPLEAVQRESASDVTVGDIASEYSHFDVADDPELWKKRNR